jgi:hypothetical protein
MGVGSTLIIVVAILAVIGVGIISWSALSLMLTIGGIAISVISLAIMVRISKDQDLVMRDQGLQLQSLDKLNEELQARKAEHRRISSLFLCSDERRYTCVMPIEFRRRPLPTIAAGDYYAWHVVQNFVDEVQIDMSLTSRDSDEGVSIKIPHGNVIFLCSPQANPPLREFAPSLELEGDSITNRDVLAKLNLPVWFGSRKKTIFDEKSRSARIWNEKVICYLHDSTAVGRSGINVLTSQVEDDYIAADALSDNQWPTRAGGTKCDLAILVRASRRLFDKSVPNGTDEKIIVIAGIHQYGTWIAGDFLQRFCRGERPEAERLFESESDFAVVLYGQFNEDTLSVESSTIHGPDAWQFAGTTWERVIKAPASPDLSRPAR